MSLAMEFTYQLLRLRSVSTRTAESALASAKTRDAAEPTSTIADVARAEVNGQTVYTLTPKSEGTGRRAIYLHGGCYLYPIRDLHWRIIETLIASSGVTMVVPLYGLAPQHTVDEAYALLDAVYEPGDTLIGDSAGGGLALGFAMENEPRAVILFSPWVDVTMSNPAVADLQKADRMLGAAGLKAAGEWWAGSRATTDPRVSPLLGDLTGLPPLHIYQGGRDVLAADVQLLAERTGASLTFVPGGIHDYVGAPWTPEARAALADVGRVLRS